MIQSKNRAPPVPYNFKDQVPIRYQDRTCTDVLCIIIGVIFSVILFIFAAARWNKDNYVKSNFPTDSDGRLCGVDDAAAGYPLVYFANAPNFNRRVCVSKCPKAQDTKLECLMTETVGCRFNDMAGFEVVKYESQDQGGIFDRSGGYCLPKDEALYDQLTDAAGLKNRFIFISSLDSIVLSMILSASISVLYLILVQFMPKIMNKAVIILCLLVILAIGICVLTYSHDNAQKIAIGILLLVLFIVILLSYCRNRKAIDMNGVFLYHATRVAKDKCCTFVYILLFLAFLTVFILMIIAEFMAFWTGADLGFDTNNSIYWEYVQRAGSITLSVFMMIQAIWGLSFLKQAFNFCVSGNAVDWYYQKNSGCCNSIRALVCKHFGSVVGGSFMIGFFTLFDYVLDIFKAREPDNTVYAGSPNQVNPNQGKGCYARFWDSCFCRPCRKVNDLVRSDAMAYIHIAGNPYCNAARYCQYLSENSVVLQQNQETSRTYRLCAHLFIAGVVGIVSLYSKGTVAPVTVLVSVFASLFISTFFISFHADIAQAVAISFIDNEQCEKRRLSIPQQGWSSQIRKSTLDQVHVYHPQISDDVKKVLDEHPYTR